MDESTDPAVENDVEAIRHARRSPTFTHDLTTDAFVSLLAHVAGVAYRDDGIAGLNVTLIVNGAVLSGTMIARQDWLERQRAALTPEGQEPTGWPATLPDDLALNPDDILDENYVHLANANVIESGGSIPTTADGMDWRVRMSDISAITLGSLASSTSTT